MRYKNCVAVLLFTAITLFVPAAVWGQGNTGSIWGVAVDQQSLRLPNVSLTLQDSAGGLRRDLTTGADGTFDVYGLPAGDYRLTATLAGMRTAQFQIRLEVNQRARMDKIGRAHV